MSSEEVRDIQYRTDENFLSAEHKGDEQSSNTTIAIKKGMDGFKLCVNQANLQQYWDILSFRVYEFFEIGQRTLRFFGRRRYKSCFTNCSAFRPNPILFSSDFPRSLISATHSFHKALVNLSYESYAYRHFF